MVRVHDVITAFKFGDDRFRGFWLAEGQSLPFPIDFEGRPYNTHTIVLGVIYGNNRSVAMVTLQSVMSVTMDTVVRDAVCV